MTASPTLVRHSSKIVHAVLGMLLLMVGFLLGQRAAPAPTEAAQVLLEAERVLLSEGTDFTFTVPAPGPVSVRVALSENCTSETTVTVGPLRTALRPDVVYEPEAEPEHLFSVRAGADPRTLELAEAGPYVLRLAPIPMAMGSDGAPSSALVVVRTVSDGAPGGADSPR